MFLRYIIAVDRVVRWYRSARRHRVGKAHAMHVIASTEPMHVPASVTADARRVWIPNDDRASNWRLWRWISKTPWSSSSHADKPAEVIS
jgi:hypothetical protein